RRARRPARAGHRAAAPGATRSSSTAAPPAAPSRLTSSTTTTASESSEACDLRSGRAPGRLGRKSGLESARASARSHAARRDRLQPYPPRDDPLNAACLAARQRPADHQPLDLVRPFEDLEDLRVPHPLLDRELPHVPVAA